VYDQTIQYLRDALGRARVGNEDRIQGLKALSRMSLAVERAGNEAAVRVELDNERKMRAKDKERARAEHVAEVEALLAKLRDSENWRHEQEGRWAAIVHDRDDHAPFVAPRFGFGLRRDAFGVFQREDGFAGHGYSPSNYLLPKAAKT